MKKQQGHTGWWILFTDTCIHHLVYCLKNNFHRLPKFFFLQSEINDHFSSRLHQTLCYFYAGVLSDTLPASAAVKEFLAKTNFDDAFRLLSKAVLPETKEMIREGRIVGLAASFLGLRQDCWVSKQGCYINKVTTPKKEFGLYVGGSASVAPNPSPITRPLRGELTSMPYSVRLPGVPCGIGRRIAQHLDDGIRLRYPSSAHYKFMEESGNQYDFRLLSVFEKKVEIGAVWLLEAFFALELGTISHPKPETNRSIYTGLNRASPLITNCLPSIRLQKTR